MLDALNGMMLDMLAAVARKDFEDRRRRQAQGVERGRAEGRYKGRPEDLKRNAGIAAMLKAGSSWTQIQAATRCSRATIAKIAKRGAVASIHEPVKPRTERVRMNKLAGERSGRSSSRNPRVRAP